MVAAERGAGTERQAAGEGENEKMDRSAVVVRRSDSRGGRPVTKVHRRHRLGSFAGVEMQPDKEKRGAYLMYGQGT